MFIIQSLPFFQDIREYTFPVMPKIKDDELVMFEQLIDSMQLVKPEINARNNADDMQKLDNLSLNNNHGVNQ